MPKRIADQDVFEASLQVVAERGYAGATTRALAEAAGINEVTLFRKYGSKSELIVRALTEGAFNFAAEDVAYSGDLEADLVRAAETFAIMLKKNGHLFYLVMIEMARHAELREAVRAPSGFIRALAALLCQYRDEGALVSPEEPLQAVASFLGPLIVIDMLQNASARLAPASLEPVGHVQRFLRGRT